MTAISDVNMPSELSTLGGTARFRRTAMAIAMFVAPWGTVLDNAVYSLSRRRL